MKRTYIIILFFVSIAFVSATEAVDQITFNTESKFIYDICHSTNGEVIVCTDNKSLKAFSVKTKELLATFSGGHNDKILCLDMSRDSTMLVSGGGDSTVVVWDIISRKMIEKIDFATGKITSVKFSPNSQFILFGCSNSKAYLYDTKAHKRIHEFNDFKKDINSVAFSSNGEKIAIAGADKEIWVYDTTNFKSITQLVGHRKWIREIAFYDNDNKIISCGDDKIIEWNLLTHKYVKIKINKGWGLSVDIINENFQGANMYVYGTMGGLVSINSFFANYTSFLKTPISKVLLIPNKNSQIILAVGTLGAGMIYLDAINMNITK
jgi:WD40 repeat protein